MTNFDDLLKDVVAPPVGTLGIGVGNYFDPIFSRGETEPVFQSTVWFPFTELAEAQDFATATGLELVENIPL